MLDEGVVAEAQDIDLCMILGAGWPFHLGGVTPYLDRSGTSERVTGKRFLPTGRGQPARLIPVPGIRYPTPPCQIGMGASSQLATLG